MQILLAPPHGSVRFSDAALETVDRRLQSALILLEPGTAAHLLIDAAAELIHEFTTRNALSVPRDHFPVARRLLRNAVEYLELHAAESTTYTFRITAAGIAALDNDRVVCQYCGCTETDPCEIPRALLGERELATVTEYFAKIGEPVPEIIPCGWLDVDDATVCSHPACAAKYAAEGHR